MCLLYAPSHSQSIIHASNYMQARKTKAKQAKPTHKKQKKEACKEREKEARQKGNREQGTSASFGGKRVMHVQQKKQVQPGGQGQARKRHKSQLSR